MFVREAHGEGRRHDFSGTKPQLDATISSSQSPAQRRGKSQKYNSRTKRRSILKPARTGGIFEVNSNFDVTSIMQTAKRMGDLPKGTEK